MNFKDKFKKPVRPGEVPLPAGRQETVRQQIIAAISGEPLSAKEISAIVKIREKEVNDHLCHIHKTFHNSPQKLIITPSECKKCGFVFVKRDKMKKPGKCPVCRHEAIVEPLFLIG